jgi:hypothetical protein
MYSFQVEVMEFLRSSRVFGRVFPFSKLIATDKNSFWKADSCLDVYEVTYLLWNLNEYYYHAHKNPLFYHPILNQLKSFHIVNFHVFKIHFNIIFRATYNSLKCRRPFRFSDWNLRAICQLSNACYLFHKKKIIWSENVICIDEL